GGCVFHIKITADVLHVERPEIQVAGEQGVDESAKTVGAQGHGLPRPVEDVDAPRARAVGGGEGAVPGDRTNGQAGVDVARGRRFDDGRGARAAGAGVPAGDCAVEVGEDEDGGRRIPTGGRYLEGSGVAVEDLAGRALRSGRSFRDVDHAGIDRDARG